MRQFTSALVAGCLLLGPTISRADNPPNPNDQPPTPPGDNTGTPNRTAPPTPSGQLPPTESSHQEQPPVPMPSVPGAQPPVEQAGVGGTVGYGRAGVLELGGFLGLNAAQNVRDLNFSPMFGWFIVDNLELSAIGSVADIKSGMDETTLFSALIEPSLHLPFNREVFGFAGLGVGAAYINRPGLGAGLAVAPRIGANFMIGRSGILSPSLTYEYTTHNTNATTGPNGTEDVTLVAISSALRVNVGYTVMW
jgi:hypothetical protein